MNSNRRWTVYLAQDKHLDYNWCGTNTEIEVRMAALLDYYLGQAEEAGGRWNLDGTLWLEVYRRHRGEKGAERLLNAIRRGWIGYAANRSVLLWGLMSTELAIRACYGSAEIEEATGILNRTALIMENPGLPWGAANVLTECGVLYLGRGIYSLRAEGYQGDREPYPLFWWEAPNGGRMLVRWDLYAGTRTWGGYAEAAELGFMGGERHDPFHMQTLDDRGATEVYERRRTYIEETVERYAAYGKAYPISSILLLGSGHDQWTTTSDYRTFVERFNADSDGRVRLVDARYEDFFEAAHREIREGGLEIPTLRGSFGICWEEWGAHLGGMTRDFREAERLLRRAEADRALAALEGDEADPVFETLRQGFRALLDFAEHDMGGCTRRLAALSAGVRAGAAAQAMDIGRSLGPDAGSRAFPTMRTSSPEQPTFAWHRGRVMFDEKRCGVRSVLDGKGREWVPQGQGPAFGEFVHTRYEDTRAKGVFPEALVFPPKTKIDRVSCRRGRSGVEVRTEGARWGFGLGTRWFFHAAHPWIDVTYCLADGWSDDPQTVQFCFPLTLEDPAYRYDMAGAVLAPGPASRGGDDLPGANPELFAAQTFASAAGRDRFVILLTPDAFLIEFGTNAVRAPGYRLGGIPSMIASMPLMNLTRNDRQLGQGGQRAWTFRYRVILASGRYDPLRFVREAQCFGTPPFLRVPGGKPDLKALEALEISFDGGPVLAVKTAEDGERLILRFWNVLDRTVEGGVMLPERFGRAELCDALERRKASLPVRGDRAMFTAAARGIVTVALCRG